MSAQPPTFLNYITDQALRTSLESDYREMTAALANKCWKAVHILAGSLIEAILIDHLLSKNPKNENAILKIDLNDAINQCKDDGVLTDQPAALCVVIKNYRNLIHPGRVKRLDEKINDDNATVAATLVKMVAEDIAQKRRETYGYTGEQVIAKINNDAEAFPTLMPSILAKVFRRERERLLFELLPAENSRLRSLEFAVLDTAGLAQRNRECDCLRLCFRVLVDSVDDNTKKRLLEKYLSILHDGSAWDRRHYESGLLCKEILDAAENDERKTLKEHLYSQLRQNATAELLNATRPIGKWMVEDRDFELIRALFVNAPPSLKSEMKSWVSNAYWSWDEETRNRFRKNVEGRIELYSSIPGYQKSVELLSELLADLEESIPF